MDVDTLHCEHRWRYFVNIETRAVRVRECERCRQRSVLPAPLAVLTGGARELEAQPA
jgi:hypothetical protein